MFIVLGMCNFAVEENNRSHKNRINKGHCSLCTMHINIICTYLKSAINMYSQQGYLLALKEVSIRVGSRLFVQVGHKKQIIMHHIETINFSLSKSCHCQSYQKPPQRSKSNTFQSQQLVLKISEIFLICFEILFSENVPNFGFVDKF